MRPFADIGIPETQVRKCFLARAVRVGAWANFDRIGLRNPLMRSAGYGGADLSRRMQRENISSEAFSGSTACPHHWDELELADRAYEAS